MGTVVHAGSGRGVVVATGPRTEFGKIAAGLSTHQLDTEFQVGLRKFSMLLVYVAGALTTSIFVINVVLHKPIMDALLFSLAIAVGITPQLLPAVVSSSLAAGSRRMSRRKVLVKRLVCIEDLGNVDVLFTDKTGTLTAGPDRLHARGARRWRRPSRTTVLRWGLLCTENATADGQAVGGNPLDQALWDSPAAAAERAGARRLHPAGRAAVRPRAQHGLGRCVRDQARRADAWSPRGHRKRCCDRCLDVPRAARAALAAEFAAGNRVVAVATRPATDAAAADAEDEHGLRLAGLLVFLDPPKARRRRSRCGDWPASASRSRSSPATTRPSPPRSAATSGSAVRRPR